MHLKSSRYVTCKTAVVFEYSQKNAIRVFKLIPITNMNVELWDYSKLFKLSAQQAIAYQLRSLTRRYSRQNLNRPPPVVVLQDILHLALQTLRPCTTPSRRFRPPLAFLLRY